MANKIDPMEHTALKSITLVKSVCELFVTELPTGTGQIMIGLERELVGSFEFVDKSGGFSISAKLDVTGYVPDSDKKVFDANCEIIAKYDVVSEIQIPKDELIKSLDNFTKQFYPFSRSIVVDQMAKMGIYGLDAPWDMSDQLISSEQVEAVKLSPDKKKAARKKVAKKKVAKKKINTKL